MMEGQLGHPRANRVCLNPGDTLATEGGQFPHLLALSAKIVVTLACLPVELGLWLGFLLKSWKSYQKGFFAKFFDGKGTWGA